MTAVGEQARIGVQMLGRFQVRAGERTVIDRAWPHAKAKALLKLLALPEGRTLHREQVFEALWPDLDGGAAANNLRQALHQVRNALTEAGIDSPVIERQGDLLTLSSIAILDVDIFRERGERARGTRTDASLYEEALSMYGGDLLPEDAYDEWAQRERETLKALHRDLLTEVAALHQGQGSVGLAVQRLQQVLEDNPVDEDAHRMLIRAYSESGQRERALRQYEACRLALERELGVEPSVETDEVYRQALKGTPAFDTATLGPQEPLDAQRMGGTTTILFTDLVGSTAQRQRLGDEAGEDLRRVHFRLLREAVRTHGGHEVKNLGDGLMVAFTNTIDAIGCAISMQQAVRHHNGERQREGEQLHVRVGMHVGEPIRAEADYFGTVVDIAGRLCARAAGGQIIASDLVRRVAGSRGGYTFRNLGRFALKGISEPIAACEVLWESLRKSTAEPVQTEPDQPRITFPPPLGGRDQIAFVGREEELGQLRRRWAEAASGSSPLVLLGGQPGIGKTRLAAEFAKLVYKEGASVLYGRCDEDPITLYQPFAEALRHCGATLLNDLLGAAGERGGADLARIVPELGAARDEEPSAPDSETDRYALFEEVASVLSGLTGVAPLLVLLDDLHWAHRETLMLLRHVLRRHGGHDRGSLLVLGTYREAELDRSHPFAELIADMRRDHLVERMMVGGLDQAGVSQLIGAWAGRDAPAAFVRAVHDQTEGNPFFIEEVLRHLVESGAICPGEEQWLDVAAIEKLRLPETVKDVIRRRLARLSSDCNSLLTYASVIGQEFGVERLERGSGLSSDRIVALLEEGVAAGVVSEAPGLVDRYRFVHALTYETLHDELTTTRRVRLHGQTLMYADRDGAKLAYEVLGATGPYAVVVGISNCPAVRTRHWSSTRHWDRASRRCQTILYDRRGVGVSSAPEHGYSPLASVEDLRALLDALDAQRVVLWGATDGGPLALLFAAHYPERVAALLLLGTTAKYTSADDFPHGVNPTLLEPFFRLDPLDPRRAVSDLILSARPGRPGAEEIAEVLGSVPPRVWSKVVRGMGAADARSILGQIRCPTLIIHDPGNTYIPVGAAQYLHQHIAGSRLEITDELSSLPWGENVYRMVELFIEEIAGGG